MRNYNKINNTLGWLVFIVATVTYMLTLEPTASFWDCGEFIAQGYKLEVGHPPGNPIFMLTANFFSHFASGPETVALCVNAMSGLLSAGTILLLFWTITHLVRRLIVKADDDLNFLSWTKLAIIMGSGLCGALVYAWSDTFWFSAVEGEVYAFSSFCTALTFWLILKWENRCEDPRSDRYLIAIAYVIGVSVAVHLLNLLCIPAIILVIYYRKFEKTTVKGSLLALLLSFAIIVLILYGLVPGFVEMAQYAELLFVNTFGFSFNSGALAYALAFAGLLVWSIYVFHKQRNENAMKWVFLLVAFFSGIFFIGDSLFIPVLLTAALAVYLFAFCGQRLPVRILYNVVLYIAVIFAGYSSYALILIRSTAQTPMDQNSPDNVFALSSYLNREQYGKTPLLYGPVYSAPVLRDATGNPVSEEATKYEKEVKATPDAPDRYIEIDDEYNRDYRYSPSTNMFFPRLYDSSSKAKYESCMGGIKTKSVQAIVYDGDNATQTVEVPTFTENLRYFFQYQLNYMYWRYFLWNFAGRQNDIQGHGEITHGNWISGIPFIDNPRLGDQSLLPDELGKGNAGHNVFYMLPLLFGLIGLLWQAYKGKRGIEQFWIVFFLFFMTGIAIVIYLNQTPEQPRERDYAYAGSFYAFAIWVGMGVAGLSSLIRHLAKTVMLNSFEKPAAAIAVALGIFIPLQVVSQTWDDHDRSGRYACRDFGMNYLTSVDKNGIIFTSGDNDTFPLWYAQEVEGWRTDVRVVNLSYLATDWYMAQMRRPAYESAPLPMQADNETFAYNRRLFGIFGHYLEHPTAPKSVKDAIADYYNPEIHSAENDGEKYPYFNYPNMYIPLDPAQLVKNGMIPAGYEFAVADHLTVDATKDIYTTRKDNYTLSSAKVMSLDIISSDINEGWKRPLYFAMTVPDEYYSLFNNYMQTSGMAYEITPIDNRSYGTIGAGFTDNAYRNITEKFRWGGLDKATPENPPYFDETASRMVNTTRTAILETVANLIEEGAGAQDLKSLDDSIAKAFPARIFTPEFAADRYEKARKLLTLMEKKLPEFVVPSNFDIADRTARSYYRLYALTDNKADRENGDRIIRAALDRFAQNMRFYQSLNIGQLGAMSYIDNYLFFDGGYLSMLLTCYEGNPDLAKQEMKTLQKGGVDIWGCYKRAILRTADGSTDATRNATRNVYFTQMLYDLAEPEEIDKFFNDNDDCAQIVAELLRRAAQNE